MISVRGGVARAWLLVLAAVLPTVGLAAVDAAPAAAATSRAVVIVDTGGSVKTTVISFDGTITGLEALQLAGASPATYGYSGQGLGVCALYGVGHPATDECLGTPSDPRYWSYWRSPSGTGGFSYSRQCACTTSVSDGAVEGWRFSTSGSPPFQSFCAVAGCAPPAPPPNDGGPSGSPGAAASGSNGAPNAAPNSTPNGAPSSSGSGGSGGPASTDPSAPSNAAGAGPAVTDGTSPSTTTRRGDAAATRGRDADTRALGPRAAADDGGAGSPVGVLAALAVVALIAVVAVALRRRARTPT